MGLFDTLGKMASSAAKQRASFARDFERNNSDMDAATREKLDKFNKATEKMASFGGTSVRTSSSSSSKGTYNGKTVSEWDRCWQSIGYLKDADLSPYGKYVGLYRHVIDGKTMYVGRAIELNNGGFRKRLNDYRRESDSARKHSSGKIIHENLDRIETYIMIVGDTQSAVEATKRLEGIFIDKYNPQFIIEEIDLKLLLAEILQNFKNQGKCYVKYEVKQGCFHIRVLLSLWLGMQDLNLRMRESWS